MFEKMKMNPTRGDIHFMMCSFIPKLCKERDFEKGRKIYDEKPDLSTLLFSAVNPSTTEAYNGVENVRNSL